MRFDPTHALFGFATAYRNGHRSRSRGSLLKWQQKQLSKWLLNDLGQVAFYGDMAPVLEALPILQKDDVMSQFAAFNRGGITADAGWSAYHGSGQIGDISIGASTGTSGNRSLYAITSAERFRWLGAIIAKAIPQFLWQSEKVVVLLPQASKLYDTANQSRLMSLLFLDLMDGPDAWLERLIAFAPTTIVAPPRVLRFLTESNIDIAPRRLFAGGETLDPIDRQIIEAHFKQQLGQIYMATEGLLGVTCRKGTLHLAEDSNFFEFEAVGDGLVNPIITSFARRFQIMARYRMNDLLRLSQTACSCGSPLQAVEEVIGRADDVFEFPGGKLVTPDVIRNAVLNVSPQIQDFRVERVQENSVVVTLPTDCPPELAERVDHALQDQFHKIDVSPQISIQCADLKFDRREKLRRVKDSHKRMT